VGVVAVGVAYGVGYVVHRVGRLASTGMAVTSAALAGAGILLGFVLTQLVAGMQALHGSFLDAVDFVGQYIGWGEFIVKAPGDALSWAFLAIGAFAAFRLVAQQPRAGRRA
jgi:hypothetical protein